MDQYIGKMLDNRYEILERIGTGGMAVVYKARCHRLNRLVAIKILKPELAGDEDFLRRFQDESQAVAMLSHINIVSIYDVCRSDGLDYIVMELIDGMTLKQYMQKRGTPLNWRESLHFVTQVVRALGHAHSRGIVHRDIKPHNIMVLRDGSVKVADFGIARLISAAEATLTSEALGSVHYISPEQAKGSHVDGRSDLYSVGVMLYEMLTGRLPFEGETPVFVAIQHINSIPIAPRELNPEIPEALEAITMKAMSANLSQRYASAEDMLSDLKEFRRNPGAVLPSAGGEEGEDEPEEPTMVVPLESIHSALEENAAEESDTAAQDEPTKPLLFGKQLRRREQEDKKVKKPKKIEDEDDDDDYQPHRRWNPIPTLIGVLIVLLFIAGIVYFFYNILLKDLLKPDELYTIPDLKGYTIEELLETPSLLQGFTWEEGPTIYDAEYEAGQICRQEPGAGQSVKDPDTVITITISSGEDTMPMPDVENMEAREALTLLQDQMGLVVEQEWEYSEDYTASTVMSYTPMEGTILARGDTVTITISRGPKDVLINVPSFINMNINQAQSQAKSLGLVVGKVEYFHSDEYRENRVMWQSVEAKIEADPGTRIDFHVSLGPEPEPSPSPEPSPEPTDDIPLPTPDVETVRPFNVDLSAYEGAVHVRIVVGGITLYDSTVDCSQVSTLTCSPSGTGTKQVQVYIDGSLADSFTLEF